MSAEKVSLDIIDGVAELWMHDQPGNNAFSSEFVDQLLERMATLARAREAKVCVLRGLPAVFCAGGDRRVLLDLAEGNLAPYDLELTRTLLELPIPTIAAMEGHAVGGGLVFGLACDMVVMARESRYGCNFMDLGFTPGTRLRPILDTFAGDPRAYRVRGTTIALRRDQSSVVIVRPITAAASQDAAARHQA